MLYVQTVVCRKNRTIWYVPLVQRLVVVEHNHVTYGRTEQHTVFTYQANNTQFIDAPEDGSVGSKHVELSNILWINIQL